MNGNAWGAGKGTEKVLLLCQGVIHEGGKILSSESRIEKQENSRSLVSSYKEKKELGKEEKSTPPYGLKQEKSQCRKRESGKKKGLKRK